jgi:hypothetical protein
MLAMRPARYHRESRLPAEKPHTSSVPSGVAAQISSCGADTTPEFASQIAQARRDACRHPEQAALLLRSWMSDHD